MNDRVLSRALRRGVTLVEVLIVVAIMSIIAGTATVLSYAELKRARIRAAAIGAGQVRQAASIYREIDLADEGPACPTVSDLVAARKLDPHRVKDPWGTVYGVTCEGEEVHGVSAGRDRQPRTPDDVRDDVKPGEVDVIARM